MVGVEHALNNRFHRNPRSGVKCSVWERTDIPKISGDTFRIPVKLSNVEAFSSITQNNAQDYHPEENCPLKEDW